MFFLVVDVFSFLRSFWISWTNDHIVVGQGNTIEYTGSIQLKLAVGSHPIRAVSVKTKKGISGEWVIPKGEYPALSIQQHFRNQYPIDRTYFNVFVTVKLRYMKGVFVTLSVLKRKYCAYYCHCALS